MTMHAMERVHAPSDPVFLNFRSEVVHPVCFAIVFWDGPGDTLYAFEDAQAFERQCATAERHLVHVQRLWMQIPPPYGNGSTTWHRGTSTVSSPEIVNSRKTSSGNCLLRDTTAHFMGSSGTCSPRSSY